MIFLSYTIYVHVFTVMLTGFGELAVISGSPGLFASSKSITKILHEKEFAGLSACRLQEPAF